jgi:hypothetical protein
LALGQVIVRLLPISIIPPVACTHSSITDTILSLQMSALSNNTIENVKKVLEWLSSDSTAGPKNYMNVRLALCTEYECSSRLYDLWQPATRAKSLRYTKRHFISRVGEFHSIHATVLHCVCSARVEDTDNSESGPPVQKCYCKYLIRCMGVFKRHNVRRHNYVLYSHLSGVNKSETPCCSAFFDKCAVTKLVKKIPALLETDGSLHCSSKPAIWTYPEPLSTF